MGWMKDETGLEKRPANFVPLTPLSHLIRAAQVFPERTAVHSTAPSRDLCRILHGPRHAIWPQARLSKRGVNPGDVVAAVLPNTHPHVEAHFGVPACGAVLNSINIRLDVGTISYILDHGEAKIVLCDTQFLGVVEAALKEMEAEDLPLIVEVPDEGAGYHASGRHITYDQLLAEGRSGFRMDHARG
jgi:fatty-acyl-CoA synthase